MSEHYDDYVAKSIPVSEVVFNDIKEEDRELVKVIRKQHIKANKGFLIPLVLAFALCMWGFIACLVTRANSIFVDVLTIAAFGFGVGLTVYFMWDILGPVKKMCRGVVLSAQRIQEVKDNKNATYQFIFDIYIEEIDKTLMSYQVKREVFEDIAAGDGVVLFKTLKNKVKVLADPGRKGVMDVSKIRSGVNSRRI